MDINCWPLHRDADNLYKNKECQMVCTGWWIFYKINSPPPPPQPFDLYKPSGILHSWVTHQWSVREPNGHPLSRIHSPSKFSNTGQALKQPRIPFHYLIHSSKEMTYRWKILNPRNITSPQSIWYSTLY